MKLWLLLLTLLFPLSLCCAEEPPPLTESEREGLQQEADRLLGVQYQQFRKGRIQDALNTAAAELSLRRKLHREDHPELAISLNNMGYLHKKLGQLEQARPFYEESLAMRRRMAKDQDDAAVAHSLTNLGALIQELGRFEEAYPYYRDSLAMTRRLFQGQDHQVLANSLNNMGYLLNSLGQPGQALPYYQEALEMWKRLQANQDHSTLAAGLTNVGRVLEIQGHPEQARPYLQQALEMNRRLSGGKDHLDLANSLNNMGHLLNSLGQPEKCLAYYQEALAMNQRLYRGQDHPSLVNNLNNIGRYLYNQGDDEKALPYLQQSLNMSRRLYSNQDHPDLAVALSNLGELLSSEQLPELALPYYREALEMRRRLYQGQDHPYLAISLNEMGNLLIELEKPAEALLLHQEVLEMHQRLYQNQDHPELAATLQNLGYTLESLGRVKEARDHYQQALEMRRNLYQDQDHTNLASTLFDLGYLQHSQGELEEALQSYAEALGMYQRVNSRLAFASGLTEALIQSNSFPTVQNGVFSVSRQMARSDRKVYETLWTTKAPLGQLFRTRHALERQHQSEKVRTLLDEYRTVQRQLTGLLAQAVPAEGDSHRDTELKQLTETQQRLERELGQHLPEQTGLNRPELKQLTAALKPGEAFLDFFQYYDYLAAQGERHERYVAFLVTADLTPVLVELPESAGKLDAAIRDWRQRLLEWSPALPETAQQELRSQSERSGREVRRLLWEPVEKQLPKQVKRVYISPVGDLARVPFAAIPGAREQSVILEQYVLATVESGPFLLEQLTRPPASSPGPATLLVAGGVHYSPPGTPEEPWPFLQGSEQEARQVQQLWGTRGEINAKFGHEATTDWLLQAFPAARYAHLATHGEFREAEYARERLRREQEIKHRVESLNAGESSTSSFESGEGIRNPLGYVGIVMAHANQPPAESLDQGIVAGTSLWPLDLSNLHLAVLSACETELGEQTGGAGVQNLQLALHVAGCENVIASLWKVDDAATAALMAKFYYELWVRNRPPAEALREAQLLIRNRPDLIAELSGQRGRLKVTESVVIQSGDPIPENQPRPASHLPAKYWAAFSLSGTGK